MTKLKLLDTFSGIGGFSYAAEKIVKGFETIAFVECEPFCQKILNKHWPHVPIFDDIKTYSPEPHSADIITAGFPCQDISVAGRQAGIKQGTRSGLFYELMRVICQLRPRYVVLENVAAITSNGLDIVLGSLAQAGYDTEWSCIRAAAREHKDSGPNVNYEKLAKKSRLSGVLVLNCSHQLGGATYLNPCFVEEMMGYPVGWTDLNHLETA